MTDPLVVLLPFPRTPPKGNPFRVLLERSLLATPGLEVRYFTWREALLGRYDVFHQHWPEILIGGPSGAKKAVRQLLYLALLIKLRILRIPIVRTVHNLELPQGISPVELALLRLTDRWTSLRIRINPTTPIPPTQPSATILHGHYRDWYQPSAQSAAPGRMLFFGLVRRYKNVAALLHAFHALDDDRSAGLSLEVAGNPSSAELAHELTSVAAGDPRISLDLRFLSDEEIIAAVGRSELVVLPYREMHNSAGVLTALSLDRPVLVPDNELNQALAAEVGPGWVHTYAGDLDGDDLVRATSAVRTAPAVGRPDLSGRGWEDCGPAHLDAYRRACVLVGRTEFARTPAEAPAPA